MLFNSHEMGLNALMFPIVEVATRCHKELVTEM